MKHGRLLIRHWNRILLTSSCVHPRFFGRICVCHILSCLCFVLVLFLVCSKLPVSLDYPYLIAASGFSDLYLLIHNYSTVGNHTYHYRLKCFFFRHFEFPIHFFHWVLSQYFSYIVAVSFIGKGNRIIRRKSLTIIITMHRIQLA